MVPFGRLIKAGSRSLTKCMAGHLQSTGCALADHKLPLVMNHMQGAPQWLTHRPVPVSLALVLWRGVTHAQSTE